MRRLAAVAASAFLGATVGYVIHQVFVMDEDRRPPRLIVGAPVSVGLVATLAGLTAGTHDRGVAFVAGVATGAALGVHLDDQIPGWSRLRRTAG